MKSSKPNIKQAVIGSRGSDNLNPLERYAEAFLRMQWDGFSFYEDTPPPDNVIALHKEAVEFLNTDLWVFEDDEGVEFLRNFEINLGLDYLSVGYWPSDHHEPVPLDREAPNPAHEKYFLLHSDDPALEPFRKRRLIYG